MDIQGTNAKMKGGNNGFTLLETIMALAIAGTVIVFALGFIRPQIELYDRYDRKSQAKAMCHQAYVELEKVLRYGYIYYVDPACPGELSYYVRKVRTHGAGAPEEGPVYEVLPPVYRWPVIEAKDLPVDETEDMTLALDFQGTLSREVKARIMVVSGGEIFYEQDVVIHSMYDYQVEGG